MARALWSSPGQPSILTKCINAVASFHFNQICQGQDQSDMNEVPTLGSRAHALPSSQPCTLHSINIGLSSIHALVWFHWWLPICRCTKYFITISFPISLNLPLYACMSKSLHYDQKTWLISKQPAPSGKLAPISVGMQKRAALQQDGEWVGGLPLGRSLSSFWSMFPRPWFPAPTLLSASSFVLLTQKTMLSGKGWSPLLWHCKV